MGWGARLQHRLTELDLTVADLARRMGRGDEDAFVNLLYKYVKDGVDNPRGTTIKEIAEAIGMSEQQLRFGPTDNVPAVEPDDPDTAQFPTSGIAEIDVRAGMGGGGVEHREVRRNGNYADPVKTESWSFPATFVRQELRAPADRLIIIETQGDSMSPTITPGERVVVDTGHKVPSPDGIYAIRDRFGAIIIKRLQVLRRGDPPIIKLISDNRAHVEEDVGADEIEIVGRVICGLKRY